MDDVDEQMIQLAVDLGRQGAEAGAGGPFGSVVARGGEVIGQGHNSVLATHDPTAHAEVNAIRDASRALGSPHLDGTTLYASCEPCPMCAGAALWARVDRVVYASSRADALEWGRFDDDAFWDDIIRPLPERQLPHTQVGRDRALVAWRWFSEHASDLHY
ncbi:nucleoside deaminase [Aquihabitans sp. McL0605]|uniref:nucleoside deaminase n=1 Tax=Aquihabitans sp. McL0605 TaxID=3415671 RepID=UPI003CF2EB0F